MLLPGPQCLMGPCTASHCCCLHRHTLPCATFRSPHTAGVFHFFCHRVLADYGPPIAAARPLICHGPLYRLLMLLPGPQCLMPCATFRSQVSSHCWCVPFFVIGCWQITGLP
ncbi:unnamed protein product [Staurois parvus]|uniref:Secreted protein n=1 Tax=Staurois parvus TaxID=386267 RepID=A0ABN9E289_9NEOB|nr:unnamed protein product [Staurois parvus]